MSDTIIKLENISRQYRMGTVGTCWLNGVEAWWHRMAGKEDPNLKIEQANDLKSQI